MKKEQTESNLEIIYKSTDSLIPYALNSRTHDEDQDTSMMIIEAHKKQYSV